jgi:subtilisin family serine protease
MRRPQWLPRPRCLGTICATSLATLLVLTPRPPTETAAAPGEPETRGSAAEEATPESQVRPLPGDPNGQRLRHLALLGADRWHAAGYRGRGVKVAILDSGFRGYRRHLGRALPAEVTVRSFRADHDLEAKESQHGLLCAEVIHALAPEAELLLANWDPDRAEGFLEAVTWARASGARVLSCSLIMPSWSDGEGGGWIHAALTQLLGAGDGANDLLCFASAGNTAQRTWSGLFRDGGEGFHLWGGRDKDNRLVPWGQEEVSVEAYWATHAGFDLQVFDELTGKEVAHSARPDAAFGHAAIARFLPQLAHTYRVRLHLARGPAGPFHVAVLGGTLQHATPRGSISFPADGPEVIAVGAVTWSGERMLYSSCGPNSNRPKPDLTAPVPFPSLLRLRPFAGTSAAAPQAAALAALWWSRYPRWTASQVQAALRSSAQDLGPPGHDFETGYGVIKLP